MELILNSDVRLIVFNECYCFRKGIWDSNDAILELTSESSELQKVYHKVCENLLNNCAFDTEEYRPILTETDYLKFEEVVDALIASDFLINKKQSDTQEAVVRVLLGEFSQLSLNSSNVKDARPLLFISDSIEIEASAKSLFDTLNIKADIADSNFKSQLKKSFSTNEFDSLKEIEEYNRLTNLLEKYQSILICQVKVDILMIRNINEVICELGTRLLLGFLDGPFVHMCTLAPPKTADFDSLERRVLARLEDSTLYRNYISQHSDKTQGLNLGFLPVLNILLNLIVGEAILISKTGTSKFEGRLLSIYIPTIEIQVQDILKMSNSKTQGSMAKKIFEIQQIKTNKLISNLLGQE
ncbi:streptolysin associated protein SagC [Streptococcus suis]